MAMPTVGNGQYPSRPSADFQVEPVNYSSSANGYQPVIVRAQNPETPQPMPPGPPVKGPPITDFPRSSDTPPGKPIATSPNAVPPATESAPTIAGDGVFAGDPWLGSSGLGGDEPGCCPWSNPHGPCHAFWFQAEYLLWTIKQANLPPLVTTSPQGSFGVLGNNGTNVLYGFGVSQGEFSGGRFTVGMWCDECQCCGMEGSYFFLGSHSSSFNAASNGDPLLARPFFNVAPGHNAEDAELVASQLAGVGGSIRVNLTTELWGLEVNGLANIERCCIGRTDLIYGFRYLNLKENLDVTENLILTGIETIFVNDHFTTRNQFYGGQVGLRSRFNWRCWDLELLGKVALGSTHEQVDISGATIIAPAGGHPAAFTGGLLAQPTNIGHFSRDQLTVVPEVGITIGYRITERWRVFAGYSLLYWSNAVRPGDQIDRTVNGTQLPLNGPFVGPARPAFKFNDTDFFAHGANIGFEFRY
jgi:hypothetical protein